MRVSHFYIVAYMRPGFRSRNGSKAFFRPRVRRLERGREGLKHFDELAHRMVGADERRVAAVGGDGAADVGGARVGGGRRLEPNEAARPVVEAPRRGMWRLMEVTSFGASFGVVDIRHRCVGP